MAVPIGKPLGPPTRAAIKQVLTTGGDISLVESGYTFFRDGRVEAHSIYASSGEGSWSLEGKRVRASGNGRTLMGCESKDPDRDCRWSFSMEWEVLAVGDGAFVASVISDEAQQISAPETPQLLICRKIQYGGEMGCHTAGYDGGFSLAIIPGNSNRELYEKTRGFIGGWTTGLSKRVLALEGERAKTPRAVSELYFGEGREATARLVAAELAPLLGPLDVKPWPSPTYFDVLLVVGAAVNTGAPKAVAPKTEPGAAPPVRVALSDGKCVAGTKDCTNPLMAGIRAKVPSPRFKIVRESAAKNVRPMVEVWFRPGFEEAARGLAKDQLGEWVKADSVKAWTWPGEFDVLIVVGTATSP